MRKKLQETERNSSLKQQLS